MISRTLLEELHAKTKKVNDAKELASELLRTAQDRFGTKKHKLIREGKEIELTEKILWEEVFYIGPASQAGQILKKDHPEVFDAYAKQEEFAEELRKFCILEFGVDYTALTLSDYLRLTERLIDMAMVEHGYVPVMKIRPFGRIMSFFRLIFKK